MKYIAFFIALFVQTSVFAQVFPSSDIYPSSQTTFHPTTVLPKRASLKAYTPYPKDQGVNNNCVGWASAYVGRTILEAIKLGWQDRAFITKEAFSPGFTYYQASKGNDTLCQEGIAIKDAMQMLKYQGAVRYEDFQDECPCTLNDTAIARGLNYTIADYQRLFYQRDAAAHKIESVRRSLANQQPVVLGMRCPPSFENAVDQILWKPKEAPEEPVFFGHALCIIGYDDVRYGGAFEIQNSWGTSWGNEGYIWVKYSDFTNFAKYAYSITSHEQAIMASQETSISKSPLNQESGLYVSGNEYQGESKVSPDKPSLRTTKLQMLAPSGMSMLASRNKDAYELNIPYTYGESLSLKIDIENSDYVYVFGWNDQNEFTSLYSHQRPLKTTEKQRIAEEGIMIDTYKLAGANQTGTDHLCILMSSTPLELEVVMKQLRKEKSKIKRHLYKLLNRHLVNAKDLVYARDHMTVYSSKSENAIIPILIDAFHVP